MRENHNNYTWLRRSGIKYILVPEHHYAYNRLNQQEMLDDLNPFTRLSENSATGTALGRVCQTGFFTGISDTFNIFTGNHFDIWITGKGRVGVLDLLIFPLISRRLCYYTKDPESLAITKFASALVGYPLELVRFTLATLCTIAASPLVFLIHLSLKPFQIIANRSISQHAMYHNAQNREDFQIRNRLNASTPDNKLGQCSQELRGYRQQILARNETFPDAFTRLSIRENQGCTCRISKAIPVVPVMLNYRLYDLDSLLKMQNNVDPFDRTPFSFANIVPARMAVDFLEDEIQNAEAAQARHNSP